jgi:hypothetical protein
MKKTYLIIICSLLITQTVLGQRVRFDQSGASKHSQSNPTLSNGAGGPNPAGQGNGGTRPVEDPKHEYIKAFNHFVSAQNWSEASRLKAEIWAKFSYVVDFKRILNSKELARIEEYQAKYNDAFKVKDFVATKKLNNEVYSLYGVNLVDPVVEVAVNDTKLTEKDWAIIDEAQLVYNKYYSGRNFAEAKAIFAKIYDTYGVNLKTPILTKGEIISLKDAQLETTKIDTSFTTIESKNAGIRMEAIKVEASRVEAVQVKELNREIASGKD